MTPVPSSAAVKDCRFQRPPRTPEELHIKGIDLATVDIDSVMALVANDPSFSQLFTNIGDAQDFDTEIPRES